MRTSIGFTVLTLLASAGSSIGAPVSVQAPNTVVKANNHHHRRSDSQSQSLVVNMGNDKPKYSNILDMHAEAEETHHDRSDSNSKSDTNMAKDVNKVVSRSRAHNARSSTPPSIEMFPSQSPGQKAGLVDAATPNSDAHVLQTPGPDKTIVDVKAEGMDAKVNLPTNDPLRDEIQEQMQDHDDENVFNNGGSNLVGLKAGAPLNGVTDDGNGGPQGLEVELGSNGRAPANSNASNPPGSSSPRPAASSAAAPPPPPASSAAPRPSAPASSSSAAAPASSSGAPRAPASSSQAAAPASSASVNNARPAPASSSSAPVSQSQAPSPPRSSAPSSSVSPRPAPASSSSSAQAPPPARPSASQSQSQSSPEPAVSASMSDSEAEFKILPGAFGATRPGRIALNPNSNTNPNQSNGGISLESGNEALESTLGQSPNANGSNDQPRPARIEFGNLPQNTIPCDGLMVRDNGDIVDLCVEMAMFDQRPNGFDACPDYVQHEFHAHGDSKKTTDSMDTDLTKLIKLCYGVGVL